LPKVAEPKSIGHLGQMAEERNRLVESLDAQSEGADD